MSCLSARKIKEVAFTDFIMFEESSTNKKWWFVEKKEIFITKKSLE